ncbi:hypothetical protein ACFWEJ_25785 [Promicromonospora sp. NPDC060204]|uniref:hypothetical protein n=1 Tax=Promicromonospora sp. NPDC060204 TaxID=3347071 RepID=UPI003646EFB2
MPLPHDSDAPLEFARESHLFVDESKAKSFLFVAVVVPPHAVHLLRRDLRAARPKGRRDIHFNGARDGVRNEVIRLLGGHDVRSVVYRARAAKGCNPREDCVRATARFAASIAARSIVLDRDESLEAADRRWLYQELHKSGIRYDHLHRHEEPLLWAADAIAWCWQRGGAWKDKVRELVLRATDLP